MDAATLVGLLAEDDRRRVAAALILGSLGTADIAQVAGVELKDTVQALERLRSRGLVEGGHEQGWVLLEAAFGLAARAAAADRQSQSEHEHENENESPSVKRVLDSLMVDGRLVRIPTKRSTRLVLLDHLAQRFEPGRRYSEREVNASLAAVHEDTAALRRYLVDEQLMDRADGEYWRSGGTVR
ncbi:MAG: DUF2087 domain-containing protein [Actinomycetia bacterium]|nr:DUF2087 domain-containing protein [Actinomycetes bacterium]